MRSLLVRVGADQSPGGGNWNGPVDSITNEFAYVAIPEKHPVGVGLEKPYAALTPVLSKFGVTMPDHLFGRTMHLDPDFSHLTYGDQKERAKQLQNKLRRGDRLVFYSGLRDVHVDQLIYAIIGVITVDDFILARDVPESLRNMNAHSRRVLAEGAEDIIVRGQRDFSGRLSLCIPIGEYRNRAYRVQPSLLETWGGLSVKDGYLQRSARLPEFRDPTRFFNWFESKEPALISANN